MRGTYSEYWFCSAELCHSVRFRTGIRFACISSHVASQCVMYMLQEEEEEEESEEEEEEKPKMKKKKANESSVSSSSGSSNTSSSADWAPGKFGGATWKQVHFELIFIFERQYFWTL